MLVAYADFVDFENETIAEAKSLGDIELIEFHNKIQRYVQNSSTTYKAFCVSVRFEHDNVIQWNFVNHYLSGEVISSAYFEMLRDIEKIKNPKAYEDYKKRLLEKAKR